MATPGKTFSSTPWPSNSQLSTATSFHELQKTSHKACTCVPQRGMSCGANLSTLNTTRQGSDFKKRLARNQELEPWKKEALPNTWTTLNIMEPWLVRQRRTVMECRGFAKTTSLSHVDELYPERVSTHTRFWERNWANATASRIVNLRTTRPCAQLF